MMNEMEMNKIDDRIVKFIRKHHVLTLATCSENKPWCCNCFYAYNEELNFFVFTSDFETRHIKEAVENINVAGSIVLETSIVGKIQGVQFSGQMYLPENEKADLAAKTYYSRFPFAVAMKTVFWVLEPGFIKFTDNRLGFGKKLIWSKF